MEIAMSRIVRRKSPKEHRRLMPISESVLRKRAELTIEYEVSMTSLTSINEANLTIWEKQFEERGGHPLDALYLSLTGTRH
jgi:hypothetical protein